MAQPPWASIKLSLLLNNRVDIATKLSFFMMTDVVGHVLSTKAHTVSINCDSKGSIRAPISAKSGHYCFVNLLMAFQTKAAFYTSTLLRKVSKSYCLAVQLPFRPFVYTNPMKTRRENKTF